MSKPADFVRWVTDPARTNDELFTVELLLDRMRVWQHWPFRERSLGFDEAQKVKKERRFNPAYRPFLALDELEALQERADTVTHFSGSGMSDRPLRDLTALSFFPALENINIDSVDVVDLSPLGSLPKLNWLTLMESPDLARAHRFDFGQLGEKPALDHLWLSLRQPWADLTAWQRGRRCGSCTIMETCWHSPRSRRCRPQCLCRFKSGSRHRRRCATCEPFLRCQN